MDKQAKKRKLQILSKNINHETQREVINNENEDPKNKKFKKEDLKLDAQLKSQSDMFWKLKDALNSLPIEIIKLLLQNNGQRTKRIVGREDLLTFLTDCMLFGPLQCCTKCGYGQFVFRDDAYYCTGFASEWTFCQNKTQNPIHRPYFIIKQEFKDKHECLKSFQFKIHQRIFAKSLEAIEKEKQKFKKIDSVTRLPLYHLYFSSCGKLSKTNEQIKLLIEKYGGTYTTELNTFTCAVISNREELERMNEPMRQCESLGLCVVREELLSELVENSLKFINAEDFILKFKISEWNCDLKQTIENSIKASEQKKLDEKAGKSMSEEKSGIAKMRLKNGAVVDPDSGLENDGHVLLEDKTQDPYSSVLSRTELALNLNSFYKLQIIEHDDKQNYYVFRAWGRIGTDGDKKLQSFKNKEKAIEEFCRLYLEKTSNRWDERRFAIKRHMKFYPIELDYKLNVIFN